MLTDKDIFNRTELLLGAEAMEALAATRVILFGAGGVGSWCAEGLVRSGIRHLTLVDADCIAPSNLNRQLMATVRTLGRPKVGVLKERLLDINPNAQIRAVQAVYSPETSGNFKLDEYDYVIDAVDSLKDKIHLLLQASASRATLFCAMGAALKIDPTRVQVAEFREVKGCPLAAAIRKKMHQRKTLPVKPFLCVFDAEVLENRGTQGLVETDTFKKARINGTTAPVTAIFGMTLAGLVLQDVVGRSSAQPLRKNPDARDARLLGNVVDRRDLQTADTDFIEYMP